MVVAAVLGGGGRMGEWFASFLKKNGYQVIICDTNKSKAVKLARKKKFRFVRDARVAVKSAQLVILATPTNITKNLLRQIEPYTSSSTLLVEISSVKEPLRRILLQMRNRGISILSMHPMFGPGVKTLAEQAIITVLLPRSNSTAEEFLSLFRKKGVKIFQSDLTHHDRFTSISLALPHFMNIAMVNTLKRMGVSPNELHEIAGTTFKLQLLVAEALYQETLSNETSILIDNEHALNALRTFTEESNRVLNFISKGKRGSMLRTLGSGRKFIQRERGFSSAYNRFNVAVEASSPH